MEHGVSQWTVATRLRYHLRNIQRIEGGTQQPGFYLPCVWWWLWRPILEISFRIFLRKSSEICPAAKYQ